MYKKIEYSTKNVDKKTVGEKNIVHRSRDLMENLGELITCIWSDSDDKVWAEA